jgi:hypothetical protein
MKKSYYQKIYNIDSWLKIHITQLNYTRNLILTLAVASLGFTIGKWIALGSWGDNLSRGLTLFGSLFLVISIMTGLKIAMDDSENYRRYRKISRLIEQSDIAPEQEFDESIIKAEVEICDRIENQNRERGKYQIIFFLIGLVAISISFFIASTYTVMFGF